MTQQADWIKQRAAIRARVTGLKNADNPFAVAWTLIHEDLCALLSHADQDAAEIERLTKANEEVWEQAAKECDRRVGMLSPNIEREYFRRQEAFLLAATIRADALEAARQSREDEGK